MYSGSEPCNRVPCPSQQVETFSATTTSVRQRTKGRETSNRHRGNAAKGGERNSCCGLTLLVFVAMQQRKAPHTSHRAAASRPWGLVRDADVQQRPLDLGDVPLVLRKEEMKLTNPPCSSIRVLKIDMVYRKTRCWNLAGLLPAG